MRQDFHEYVSSYLLGTRIRSYCGAAEHRQTVAFQDVHAIFHIRLVSVHSDVLAARGSYILRGSAQRLLRFPRLWLHPSCLWADRIAMPPFVRDLRKSPWYRSLDQIKQSGDDRPVREASPACARARAQDTVALRVDRDDFVHFQLSHPVYQYFPNVQGCLSQILHFDRWLPLFVDL